MFCVVQKEIRLLLKLDGTMNIKDKVKNFKTESDWGFTKEEIEELLKDFPNINREKFNDALGGITVMLINGKIRIYPCDIEKALYCGIENRELTNSEWD